MAMVTIVCEVAIKSNFGVSVKVTTTDGKEGGGGWGDDVLPEPIKTIKSLRATIQT